MKRGSWALWHREEIQDLFGDEYLTRLRIVMTPWFSLYYHQIHKEDFDRALHDHPFWFTSLIISGGYWEQCVDISPGTAYGTHQMYVRERKLGSIASTPLTRAHRISTVKPKTKTLVLTGKRRPGEDSWGFWEFSAQEEHIPWREYLRSIGHPQSEKE